MKRKPDILVVLAVVLGLGIVVSSVGNTPKSTESHNESQSQVAEMNR